MTARFAVGDRVQCGNGLPNGAWWFGKVGTVTRVDDRSGTCVVDVGASTLHLLQSAVSLIEPEPAPMLTALNGAQAAPFAAEHAAAKWIGSPTLFGVDRSGGLGAADHAARDVVEALRSELATTNSAFRFFKARCEKLDLEVSLMPDERRRANELSDRCGALETEKRDLLVENATLRRRVDVLERDAKRGRR